MKHQGLLTLFFVGSCCQDACACGEAISNTVVSCVMMMFARTLSSRSSVACCLFAFIEGIAVSCTLPLETCIMEQPFSSQHVHTHIHTHTHTHTHTRTYTQGPKILGEFFGIFVADGRVNANALLQPVLDEPPESLPEGDEPAEPPLVERGAALGLLQGIFAKCVGVPCVCDNVCLWSAVLTVSPCLCTCGVHMTPYLLTYWRHWGCLISATSLVEFWVVC